MLNLLTSHLLLEKHMGKEEVQTNQQKQSDHALASHQLDQTDFDPGFFPIAIVMLNFFNFNIMLIFSSWLRRKVILAKYTILS